MTRVYNFCAGPAMLPTEVMEQAQQEFLDWQGQGCSVMELSHRSKAFIELAEQAEQDLRELLDIPSNYRVLFTHGGGRGQFSAVPLNLTNTGDKADFLVSGAWSRSAIKEAQRYLRPHTVAEVMDVDGVKTLAPQDTWSFSDDASYFHYCPNETVDGFEIQQPPEVNAPIVADMSSTILSKPIDIADFALVYAGAQKNIGPSGLSVVIVREDMLGHARTATPSIFDYQRLADHGSMYNTPPTYAWYLAGLVFAWLKRQGGVDAMAKRNQQKSELLYNAIDGSDFYRNAIDPKYRSRMNVPFQLANADLDQRFLAESEAAGLKALKGHRMVGGMRASLYNAMPFDGVKALVDFMHDFEKRRT